MENTETTLQFLLDEVERCGGGGKWRAAGEEAAQAIVDLRRYVLELRRLVAIGSGNSFDIDGARLQLDVAEVHLHTLEKMVRKEVEDGKVTG